MGVGAGGVVESSSIGHQKHTEPLDTICRPHCRKSPYPGIDMSHHDQRRQTVPPHTSRERQDNACTTYSNTIHKTYSKLNKKRCSIRRHAYARVPRRRLQPLLSSARPLATPKHRFKLLKRNISFRTRASPSVSY